MTRYANTTCRPRPQATVFPRMARRLVENSNAKPIMVSIPSTPTRRCMRRSLLYSRTGSQEFFRADYFADEWRGWRSLVANFETFGQEAHGWNEARVQVVVHCAQVFAGPHSVAHLFFEYQAHRRIDRVFLFFSSAAEEHAGYADLLAVNRRDVSRARRVHVRSVFRVRQTAGIANHVRITSLQADHFAECITRASGSNHFCC